MQNEKPFMFVLLIYMALNLPHPAVYVACLRFFRGVDGQPPRIVAGPFSVNHHEKYVALVDWFISGFILAKSSSFIREKSIGKPINYLVCWDGIGVVLIVEGPNSSPQWVKMNVVNLVVNLPLQVELNPTKVWELGMDYRFGNLPTLFLFVWDAYASRAVS